MTLLPKYNRDNFLHGLYTISFGPKNVRDKAKTYLARLIDLPNNLNAALASKQDILQSGVNLKTINNQSLLGSGDLVVGGTFNGTLDDVPDGTSYVRVTPAEKTTWNAGKVGSKTVNESSIGDDKILVYKTGGDEFVFEAKPTSSVFNVPTTSYFNISRDAASVTAVFEDGIGALCLTGVSTAGAVDRISFRGRSVTSPFTIIAAINWRSQTTYHRQGLMLSDGTRYMIIGSDNQNSTTSTYAPIIMFYSTITTYSSYPYNTIQNNHQQGLMFFRIQDNGTNLIISMSIGGAGWRQLYSASRTALFPSGVTEAGIGLAYYGNTGGEGNMVALKHWSLT